MVSKVSMGGAVNLHRVFCSVQVDGERMCFFFIIIVDSYDILSYTILLIPLVRMTYFIKGMLIKQMFSCYSLPDLHQFLAPLCPSQRQGD